jgi:hypothetical protein
MRLIRQLIVRISPPYRIGGKRNGSAFDNWLRTEREAAWDKGYRASVEDEEWGGQVTLNPYREQ